MKKTAREADLLALEAQYCSYGDTVHYTKVPKIFERCEGSFIYDGAGKKYLDLQMWYSGGQFRLRQRKTPQRCAPSGNAKTEPHNCRRSLPV